MSDGRLWPWTPAEYIGFKRESVIKQPANKMLVADGDWWTHWNVHHCNINPRHIGGMPVWWQPTASSGSMNMLFCDYHVEGVTWDEYRPNENKYLFPW